MMQKKNKIYRIIGMMSGTSLDGIDLSLATYIKANNKWNYEIIGCKTYAYAQNNISLLKTMQNENISYLKFRQIQLIYSQLIVECIQKFIEGNKQKIQKYQIDAICIHGHTIFHQPAKSITVQAANLQYIAAKLKINVIGNFRELDVHRGGQGAPLAPYGEELFQQGIYLNLGGVANVGFRGQGYDISFCNMILNKFAQKIEEQPYDFQGNLGRKGEINQQYLNYLKKCLQNNEYHSLARQSAQIILQQITNSQQAKQLLVDKMRTFYQFISNKIVQGIQNLCQKLNYKQQNQVRDVFCTGGGAYNKFLIELLNKNKCNLNFTFPSNEIIQFKEALIFGLLGAKFIQNERNCGNGIGGQLVKGIQLSQIK